MRTSQPLQLQRLFLCADAVVDANRGSDHNSELHVRNRLASKDHRLDQTADNGYSDCNAG